MVCSMPGRLKSLKQFLKIWVMITLEITLRYYAKQAGDDVKRLVTGLSQGHISESDEELFREFEAFKKWRNPKR